MAVYRREGSTLWTYDFESAGKRYKGSTGCTNKADAQAFEVARRKEAKELKDNPGIIPMSWRDLTTLWLEEGRVNRSDWQNDESRVRKLFGIERIAGVDTKTERFAVPEDDEVHTVTDKLLADLVTARRREGNSNGTINRELALVQALLEFARKRKTVKLPKTAPEFADYKQVERKGKLRYYSVAEESTLLAKLAEKVTMYVERRTERSRGVYAQMTQDQFDLVVFLLDTGARHDEVATIRKDAVDLETGRIELYRSKVDNESSLRLTKRLSALLRVRFEAVPGPYIFPAWSGGKVDSSKPRGHSTKGIQKTIDGLGFNAPELVAAKGKATIHTFRDTFAARQIKAGATLYEVQKLLGHASPQMTQKYAHMDEDSGNRAASRLDRLHGDSTKPPRVDDPIGLPLELERT